MVIDGCGASHKLPEITGTALYVDVLIFFNINASHLILNIKINDLIQNRIDHCERLMNSPRVRKGRPSTLG